MAAQIPYFAQRAGKNLFFVHYPPDGAPKKRGFVLANGFGSETDVFRAHIVHIARELQRRGYAALRFDYGGYGDSEGEFAEATPETMRDDLAFAIEQLKSREKLSEIGVFGLRIGGTIATQLAGIRDDVTALVLVEPIAQLWDELYTQLRATVSMQTVMFKEVRFTRDQIIENILAGRPSATDSYDLNVIDDGYPLSAALVEGAKRVDLLKETPTLKAPVLVLHVRRNAGVASKKIAALATALESKGAKCTVDVAVEPTLPWIHEQIYMTHSPDVTAKVLAWIDAQTTGDRA